MASFRPRAAIRKPLKGLLCFFVKLQKKALAGLEPPGAEMGKALIHSHLCRPSAERAAESCSLPPSLTDCCPHPTSWPWGNTEFWGQLGEGWGHW